MIYGLLKVDYDRSLIFISILMTFIITILSIKATQNILPHDGGRAFAINGQLSKGKPRGVGIVFIISFIVMSLVFIPLNREYIAYFLLHIYETEFVLFTRSIDNGRMPVGVSVV